MMEYTGIIVFNPPAKSLPDEVIATAQPGSPEWFHLSREQLHVLLPKCGNVPMVTEHGSAVVGSVKRGYFDTQGNACIRFKLNGDPAGQQAKSLVDRGCMRGLSLCHSRADLTVREVSICFRGARDNTGITGVVKAARSAATGSNHSEYKIGQDSTYVSSYVEASVLQVDMQAQQPVGAGIPAPVQQLQQAPPQVQIQQPQQQQQLLQLQQQQLQQQLAQVQLAQQQAVT